MLKKESDLDKILLWETQDTKDKILLDHQEPHPSLKEANKFGLIVINY